jgi:biotin operon repressor
VAASLHSVGIDVHLVHLPGLHDGPPAAKHGRDISNWLETHAIAELRRLAEATPIWTLSAEGAAPNVPSHWQRLDLAALANWRCEPMQPLIDGLIARGNPVYIAAMTQTGKTLLGLYVARTCLRGGQLFGKFAVTPVERFLYLVLEDPARRIQDRLLDMAHEFPEVPAADRGIFYIAPGFTLADQTFCTWLESLITNDRRELAFLDTYQKATPGIASFDDEAQSLILHRLADLTRRTGVTLIVLDHVRKQASGGRRPNDLLTLDDIKGTGGKAQNADCVILLERSPDRHSLKLQGFSKDFDAQVRIALRVEPRGSQEPKFSYVGDLEALSSSAKARGAATRRRALEAIPPGDWTNAAHLESKLGLSRTAILRHIKQLVAEGQLESNEAPSQFRRYRRVEPSNRSTDTVTPPESVGSKNEP